MDTTTAAHPAAGGRRDLKGMQRVRLRSARMYEQGAVAGHLGQQGDRPGWTLGRRACGLELGIHPGTG